MEHKATIAMPNLESFSGEYYNMKNKILDFQFEPVGAKQTRPNYSVGSDQDKAKIQYERWNTHRSSQQRCSMKKVVLRNFEKFTGKHLCQSLLFYKVASLDLQLY